MRNTAAIVSPRYLITDVVIVKTTAELKSERWQNWYGNNKETRKFWRVDYDKKRQQTNPHVKVVSNLRSRLSQLIKKADTIKSGSTLELVGCDAKALKIYIESKFLPGMTWANYGREGWEIDHIKPCASFDLSNPTEQKECFNYKNLQPLWAVDNRKKRNKII